MYPAGPDTNTVNAFPEDGRIAGNRSIVSEDASIPFRVKKGQDSNVWLSWDLSQESMPLQYELQRSSNAVIWQSIRSGHWVNENNTQEELSYIDREPDMPESYYRIRLTMQDGAVRVTPVKQVSFRDASALLVYPNPANREAFINLFAVKQGNAVVQVISQNGKLRCQETVRVDEGDNEFYLRVFRKLGKGLYTIRVVLNNEVLSSNMVLLK